MALDFKTLSSNPRIFRQLTTLSVEEYTSLAEKLEPEWNQREYRRKASRPNRINAPGQGHPYFTKDFTTLLFVIVMYLRTPCSNALLAVLFGVREQTIYNLYKKLSPLLQDRFIPVTKVRKPRARINTLDELLLSYPELSSLIVDGMDIQIRRPKRKQAKNYSGKSKRHVKKIVLSVNPLDGIILGKTNVRAGAVHDKRILDEHRLKKKLDSLLSLKKYADSAWTGENPANGWVVQKRARRNHPLTDSERKENRRLARIRIKVEHAIRRIRIFHRIGVKTIFRSKEKLEDALTIAINLANFKQLVRCPVSV